MATPNPKFTTGGMSVPQLEKMLESYPPAGSSYQNNKERIAVKRQINRIRERENKLVVESGRKAPHLTDTQLRNKEVSNRRQIKKVLAKKGVNVSMEDLIPRSPSGAPLWNNSTRRFTYSEWYKRTGGNPADYTMQHWGMPKSEMNSAEDARYGHDPKRVIGQTGRGDGGNFSQQELRNPEYLQRQGSPSETGVRAGARIPKGLPLVMGVPNILMEFLTARKQNRPVDPYNILRNMAPYIPYPGQQDPPMG